MLLSRMANKKLNQTAQPPAPGAPSRPTATKGGRPAPYHRASVADCPGPPLRSWDHLWELRFSESLASHQSVYLWLAVAACRGELGPDIAAVKLQDLRRHMGRSLRWVRNALEWLAAAGYAFSVPAPPEVLATGITRVFVLRVPEGAPSPGPVPPPEGPRARPRPPGCR